jgi:aspartyl-tRNA(Asn)/glutamyl-tRNA(Gln) amidotransferase subunit C
VSDVNTITLDDVRAIADLARLALTEDEVAMYAEQLSQILESFTLLQEVDTSAVEPTASVLPLKSIMRQDEAQPALKPEDAVQNAPESEDNQFRVLPVLRDDS